MIIIIRALSLEKKGQKREKGQKKKGQIKKGRPPKKGGQTAKKYGVLISDLKYSEDLRERALLELTARAEEYPLMMLNETVGYLENRRVACKTAEEVRRQIFSYLDIENDNLVIGNNDCGDLIQDEKNRVSLILCEPGSHPIGTTVENLEDAIYLGDDGYGI